MRIKAPLFNVLCVLSLVMMSASQGSAQGVPTDPEEGIVLVGRISHVEGQLLRYDPETGDWVAAVKDEPFGQDDVLLTGVGGRAEMIMPNNTWVRIDGDTQIQLIALSEEMTEVDLASGKARVYNKGAETQVKATTPFGHVAAPAHTTFDCSVGETDMAVIGLAGTVYFVHNTGGRHEVVAGASALSADIGRVAAVTGSLSPGWQAWNTEIDRLWAERIQAGGDSADYLPPGLHEEAYALEQYGRWERVYYDDAYYRFWRPVRIRAGWAPFTVGRWTRWCGDHVWLPDEPFGYLTHHYGNWIFAQGYWYWAPPVTRVVVYAGPPRLNVGFCWYPGRVGWIYSGAHVGWIPLAPHEPYYGYRRWGRYACGVAGKRLDRFYDDIHKYRHRRHAVIIHRNHFYGAGPYRGARIQGLSHDTIMDRYRMAPVIHRAVKKNYRRAIQKRPRFNGAPVPGRLKPAVVRPDRKPPPVRGNRPELGVRKNRPENSRYDRDRPVVQTGKKRPERRSGPEIVRLQRERAEYGNAKIIEVKTRKDRWVEAPHRKVKKRLQASRVKQRSQRRGGPEIVRLQREKEAYGRAKVIEIKNRGMRRLEGAIRKARQKAQAPRVHKKSPRRTGPEVVRMKRERTAYGNANVLEIKDSKVGRFDARVLQARAVRHQTRVAQRAEIRTDRPMQPRDQTGVRAQGRGRGPWRGNRVSGVSQPRVRTPGYFSGHARSGRGNQRSVR